MKLRRKIIRAGNLVKIVEYVPVMPKDTGKKRAAKQRSSTEARKRLNRRTAREKLEFLLAANFTAADYFVTLTYADGKEPAKRKTVKTNEQFYIRRLRCVRRRRKSTARLKWVSSIEHKHGEQRWHIHLVISSSGSLKQDLEDLKSLWPFGLVNVSQLFDREHRENRWDDIASYLTKERPENGKDETPVGSQIYSCARGLARPVVRTMWIEAGDELKIPANAFIYDNERCVNEYSQFRYLKYLEQPA